MNKEEIIKRYLNGAGVEALAKEYHVGKIKIRSILAEANVEIKGKGGVKKDNNYIVNDWKIEKYPEIEGYHYIAIYKSDGMIFNDYKNQGGFLTSYIKKKEGIEIPTLYDRRQYYMKTGNYWWEQWFDIIKEENVLTKKCPYCDWETKDIDNKSGAFEMHLREAHNKTIEEYLKDFPDDEKYFPVYLKKKEKEKKLSNETNYIICPICGEKLEKMTYWHLKSKHNMTMNEFREKYPDADVISANMAKQTAEAASLSRRKKNPET